MKKSIALFRLGWDISRATRLKLKADPTNFEQVSAAITAFVEALERFAPYDSILVAKLAQKNLDAQAGDEDLSGFDETAKAMVKEQPDSELEGFLKVRERLIALTQGAR